MKLLVSWVRDFVDVTRPAEELAETLALRGFEVASLDRLPDGDAVIDVEVTANRPDCLSVLGLAREIGAAYDRPVRLPSVVPGSRIALEAVPSGSSDRVTVTVEAPDLCPRYAAAVADVTPATSPAWMTHRLQAAGLRPISPFVDITNYVLLELGHPLHAFDLAKLDGSELRVRRARSGETLTTLDGIGRTLDADTLLIADRRHAQAVAGVMGGAASEVSPSTRTVAFESAYFVPVSVRRTSRRLGLKTEASARFERGADIGAPVVALQRAISLMHQIGAGRLSGPIIDCYPVPRNPHVIVLRRRALARLLGLRVPDADVTRILRALGLSVAPEGDGWQVTVPTFRVDLLREVDLIEEVGRHFGFDKLEPAFPAMTTPAPAPDVRLACDHKVRQILTAAGLSEAVTFGFTDARSAEPFAESGDIISIANPLSASFDVLRPSLLPGLLASVAHNRRYGRRDIALFEIGARFTCTGGETRGVALAWTGATTPEHWSSPGSEVDFFDVKGMVEEIGAALGVPLCFEPANDTAVLVPGRAARVVAGGTNVGLVGQLAPAIVDRAGAPRQDCVMVAELNLDTMSLQRAAPSEYVTPLPRHPFVVRDLSIVVADALPAEIIRGTIQAAGECRAAPLTKVVFFDRYQGKGIPDGFVSVSVRLTFQSPDRTLTDLEVQDAFDCILAALVREHGAVQR
jgi:phenylalanyl-tRNA synthetase beta chain